MTGFELCYRMNFQTVLAEQLITAIVIRTTLITISDHFKMYGLRNKERFKEIT